MRVAGNELSDTAQQEFSQAPFPVGSENDQIRSPIFSGIEDSSSHFILPHA